MDVLQCLCRTPNSCAVQILTLGLLQYPTTSLPSLAHAEVQEQMNSEHIPLALSETNVWDLWDKLDSRSSVLSCFGGFIKETFIHLPRQALHGWLDASVDQEIAFL